MKKVLCVVKVLVIVAVVLCTAYEKKNHIRFPKNMKSLYLLKWLTQVAELGN